MKTIFVAANILAILIGIICMRPTRLIKIADTKQKIAEPQITRSLTRWEEFKLIAERVSKEYNIPPSVTIGMAAHESGNGTSYLCRIKNNCFGYNATGHNEATAFPSLEAGIRAYAKLIATKPLYARAYAMRDNPYQMVVEIKAAGYATDPLYIARVTGNREFINYLK